MHEIYKIVLVNFLFVGVVIGQLKKGDDCQMKGKPGVCKLLTECPQADEDTRNDILSHQCEYEGTNAVVCCEIQEQLSLEPKLGLLPKLGESELSKIGKDFQERIMEKVFEWYKTTATYIRDMQHRPEIIDKVSFDLHTSENPKEALALDPDHLERFKNRKNQIVFLIHGWINSRNTPWMGKMKDAFLKRDKDTWVIIVDWKWPALQPYSISAISTYDVSKRINEVLVSLYKNHGVDKKHFLIVGHSLGGQITGFVGQLFEKETGEKLPRIIALDPAGPLFATRPADKRLNKNDAEVVTVIHTNGHRYGFKDECGTIDFFANGGMKQPGCKLINLDHFGITYDDVFCDHLRAPDYFTEALSKPTAFVAKKCRSELEFILNLCEKDTVPMGDLNTTKTGRFYLITNSQSPFSEVFQDIILP